MGNQIQITPNSLDIIIFDVEHGNCSFVQTPGGETMMLDCGDTADFSPAGFIYYKDWVNEDRLEKLVISHPDEDHISDIERTLRLLKPKRYHHPGITSQQIETHLKPKPKTPLAHYHKIASFPSVPQYVFKDIEVAHFGTKEIKFDDYGKLDTNHLSVVTFIRYNSVVICFPGDITNDGLLTLAKGTRGKEFISWIKATNIFVAPHHGRVSEEERHEKTNLSIMLKHMQPDIVIISDKCIEGQNENTAATSYYENYVQSGLIFGQGTQLQKTRKALTTRSDNVIHIQIPHPLMGIGTYSIQCNAFPEEIEKFKKTRKSTND